MEGLGYRCQKSSHGLATISTGHHVMLRLEGEQTQVTSQRSTCRSLGVTQSQRAESGDGIGFLTKFTM